MKTRLVRIGNSRGVRLPKLLIEQAGLADDVELELGLEHGAVVIRAVSTVRAGWAAAAASLAATGPPLLDPAVPTEFDRDEWTW